MEQQPTKKIGVKTILGWAFGLLLMFSGAFLLLTRPLQGIVNALAGLSVFPPFWAQVKKRWNFELSGALKVILFVVLFSMSMGLSASKESSTDKANTKQATQAQTQTEAEKPQETIYKVNDVITSKNMELTVTSVEERSSVGGQYFKEQPSEGGTLVAIQWQYKNISEKPIGMFSQPSIKLVDANDVEYSSDSGKSGSYATEVDLDRKILSDLNPGITVRDASVFEVSKEAFARGGWYVEVRADGSRYKVAAN